MNYEERIKDALKSSIKVKEDILKNEKLIRTIGRISVEIIEAFKRDNKVLLCGNGGSAADAQHIAAELSGRFYKDRKPLFAEALHVNTSYLTAVANDYSYDEVYSRLVEAKGRERDILIAISTSGNSPNIINAVEKANEIGMITIAFTGKTGGKLADTLLGYLVNVPSTDTPRIQEAHIAIGHIICELVEEGLFGSGSS